MAAAPKQVTKDHLSSVNLYFTKKFLSGEDPENTFARPDEIDQVQQAFKRALSSGDAEKVDRWFTREITKSATVRFWSAYRNGLRIQERPQREILVKTDLVRFLKKYTGEKDLNRAILSLLPKEAVSAYKAG